MAVGADAVIREPEAAVLVEDQVVRRLELVAVRLFVEDLDLAGVDVDTLDLPALVRRRWLMRDRQVAHRDEVLSGTVVADVELAVGTQLRAVRPASGLG